MDTTKVRSVLRGSMKNLPMRNSRIVRIFISSTFTDTKEERNMLMEDIHPKLSAYCKEKYGVEYQVVDMRWGVPDEASDDHLATELCLQEILNCQKLSIGPNFVTFLNQKHGYHHLQSTIVSSEFETLVQGVEETGQDPALLMKWYKQDSNSRPSVHILQPISSLIPDYRNRTGSSVQEWSDTQKELLKLLKTSSQHCHTQGKVSQDVMHKYFMSVTEEEIVNGILNAPGKSNNHCLCFIRIIDDIRDHLDHNKAGRFIDMLDKQEIDEEAQNILSSLRDQKLTKSVDRSRITRTMVKWSDDGGISRQDHDTYLTEFGNLFYNGVKSLVDKAIVEEMKLSRDNLYIEVLHHLSMAKERCSMFHGREEIIEQIQEYLSGDSVQPLTVYGPSGSGKTSILAEIARQVPFTLHDEAIVILRFLGTSPDSSNLLRLLQSLCAQILVNTGADILTIPEDLSDLLGFFHSQIAAYDKSSTKPLVIILDSLDQLTTEYAAHKLTWLPKNLPSNVRLVVSTYTDSSDIVVTLKSLFPPQNFVIVKVLGEELSYKILQTWIQNRNRSLTPSQFEIVQEAFKLCSLPLYVKLVFEEVMTWKSYTAVNTETLAYTVQSSINSLFQRLEIKHGKIFVTRGIAYISASFSGLSETELEDILSLDDVVLTDLFKFHVPPIRRIPSLLWVRVRHDIASYLADKEVDGVRVFFWYHRQFFETAEKRYLSDSEFKKEIHSLIADFFLGKWYQTPKPFTYTENQVKRLGLSSPNSEADRKVSAQPISFLYTEDGVQKERYNLRKLNKLPFHLSYARRIRELRKECLFNYKWLVTKLKATSVNHILEDFFRDAGKESLLQRVLKIARSSLTKFPESLATEITGHILPLLSDGNREDEKILVDQCLTSTKGSKTMVPYQTCYNTPNEALLFNLEHQQLPFGSENVTVSNSSKNLFAFTNNNVLIMCDLATGDIEKQMELVGQNVCKMNILKVVPNHNLLLIGSSYQKQYNIVVLVDMATADVIEQTELQKTYPAVGFTDSLKFEVTTEYVICLHVDHSLDVFERKSGKLVQEFNDIVDEVHLSPDEASLLYHVKNSKLFKIYSLKTWQESSEFLCVDEPKQVLFDPTGTEAIVVYKNVHYAHVFNMETGRTGDKLSEISVKNTSDIINGAEFSSNSEFLILQTDNGFVLYHFKSNRNRQAFIIPASVKPHHRVLDFLGHLTPDGMYFVVAYEGHFVIWNAKSGKLLQTVEISRSKTVTAILSKSGEFLVTTSKRNNFISVWKVTSLIENKLTNRPLAMKTATRYMCVSSTGETAILRGTNGNEVGVVDLIDGHIKFFISKEEDVMRPTITPDGRFGVLRAYDSDAVLKVWNTKTALCEGAVPLSSLHVRHFVLDNNKMAVYINNDSKMGELSFWTLPELKLTNTITLWEGNIADMCMFFVDDENQFMVSRQKEGEDVAIVDIVVIDLTTQKEVFTFPSVQATRTQAFPEKKSLFLLQQIIEDKKILNVLDIDSKKVLRKNEVYPQSILSMSRDGSLAIDKYRNLYDLLTMTKVHQFDPDGEYVDTPTSANSPRMLPNGCTAIWLNISAGLLMVGDVANKQMVSVCPIHSIPICMEVTRPGLVLVGCEDGRLMILQLAEEMLKENEGFISGFLTRYKKQTIKSKSVKFVSPKKVDGGSFDNKKSSLCVLI